MTMSHYWSIFTNT